MKTKVILYAKENCPLCEKVKEIVKKLLNKHRFEFKEIFVENDPELFKKWGSKVPVIEIDGKFLLYYPFVFCSVAEPVIGLKEIKRVLKPDGKLFMLEHVRAENEFLGKIMDIIDPITFNLTGAHIARRTKENLMRAGFEVKEEKIGGILRIFSSRKP